MENYRSSSGNILLLAYRRFDTKLVPEKCNIKFFLKLRNNKMYTILVYMYMYMCDVMCMCDVKAGADLGYVKHVKRRKQKIETNLFNELIYFGKTLKINIQV